MKCKFKRGAFYYSYGIDAAPEFFPFISTWIYQGYVRRDVNSLSCDKPHYFYKFAAYEGLGGRSKSRRLRPNHDIMTVSIPALRQAEQSMLTWEELLKELKAFAKYVASQNAESGKHNRP
jgi:hypothetical protein